MAPAPRRTAAPFQAAPDPFRGAALDAAAVLLASDNYASAAFSTGAGRR
ncbi:MAG TPA: hypothetical protein VES60_06770 [Nakamurella sp.]|nr:hypothetical protein [Nakamurella sp.]